MNDLIRNLDRCQRSQWRVIEWIMSVNRKNRFSFVGEGCPKELSKRYDSGLTRLMIRLVK